MVSNFLMLERAVVSTLQTLYEDYLPSMLLLGKHSEEFQVVVGERIEDFELITIEFFINPAKGTVSMVKAGGECFRVLGLDLEWIVPL